jgi:hypothetical protein
VIRAIVALLVVAAVASSLASHDDDDRTPRRAEPRHEAVTTPAAPKLRPRDVDRQDRTSDSHRDREARAFDDRQLLTALPIERDGVRVDIGGLAADKRTTVLIVSVGGRSRAFAREVYRRLLREHGDERTNYRLRWQR